SRPLYIRDIMVKNGDEDKPIWISEMNWNAVPTDFPTKPYGEVTEEQQARYVVEAYRRAQAEWPWVGVVNFWFFKRADERERDQPMYYFRMVEPDFTPLPVYDAVKEYTHQSPVPGANCK
ncbi:MAG: polymerase, partial [Chloroflexi bacterium]|nr:polymerase [Chloroflexota bacterium]